MPRRFAGIFLILAGLLLAGCQTTPPARQPAVIAPAARSVPFPSSIAATDTIPFFASDALEGRGVGLRGLDIAADFIVWEYSQIGLKPLPEQADYSQGFNYSTAMAPGPATILKVDADLANLGGDFTPLNFSAEKSFGGEVAFVGYGVADPKSGYDDYAGIDVKGKVVLAMRFEPTDEKGHSRLVGPGPHQTWSEHASFGQKARLAEEHGAVALLVVNTVGFDPRDSLIPFMSVYHDTQAAIPIIQIKRALADQILRRGDAPNLESLQKAISANFKPQSRAIAGVRISGAVELKRTTAWVKNVIGYIPGTGEHADEFIIVGAHYSHLGRGRLGHQFGPVGSIYPGADDNASGTAAVLEMARDLAKGPPPARSIVFVMFTAEEEGLVGSEFFVAHPPLPLDKVVGMINLDMVGRMKDETLFIGGAGTARDFDAILNVADATEPLRLKTFGRGGLGPSDHMSFAMKRVPVIFLFTGLHPDYHRPTDVAGKINYPGIEQVVRFTERVIAGLEAMPKEPYETAADSMGISMFGSPPMGSGGSGTDAPRRVILGVVPDYGSEDSRAGVLIAGTTPGTPAEAAGLQAGDLLTQFADQKLENLIDLSNALMQAKPGDQVVVKFVRGKQVMELKVTLAERKD